MTDFPCRDGLMTSTLPTLLKTFKFADITYLLKLRKQKMPLANFKVLVRPNPGGLEDHQKYVTKQADDLLKKQRFADLIITSEDGTSIQCHQALVGEIFFWII